MLYLSLGNNNCFTVLDVIGRIEVSSGLIHGRLPSFLTSISPKEDDSHLPSGFRAGSEFLESWDVQEMKDGVILKTVLQLVISKSTKTGGRPCQFTQHSLILSCGCGCGLRCGEAGAEVRLHSRDPSPQAGRNRMRSVRSRKIKDSRSNIHCQVTYLNLAFLFD
ncbi:hypothetical protein BJX70DRAFT_82991 [Aspergillus crustosus]